MWKSESVQKYLAVRIGSQEPGQSQSPSITQPKKSRFSLFGKGAQQQQMEAEADMSIKVQGIVEETLLKNFNLRKMTIQTNNFYYITFLFIEQALSSMGEECESLTNYIKTLEGLLKEANINVPSRENTKK